MKKIILISLVMITSSYGLAGEVYTCESTQTNFSYVFDIDNGTVKVSDPSGQTGGEAEVTYEPGTGDDIIYTVRQGDVQYGILNGEEGVRANFSHAIFESPVEDNSIECKSVHEPILESVICTKDSHRLEINFGSFVDKNVGPLRLPTYTLYEDGKIVGSPLNFIKLAEKGYQGLLNSYVWFFTSDRAKIGLAIPGLGAIVPGVYFAAKADLLVNARTHALDGVGFKCSVTVK